MQQEPQQMLKQAARANQLLYEMMTNWSPEKELVIRFEGNKVFMQHYKDNINVRLFQEKLAKLGITTDVNFHYCG